jgi:hypothetical protein
MAGSHSRREPIPVKFIKPKLKLSKTSALLKLLRSSEGASIVQLQHASGWQAYSVPEFLGMLAQTPQSQRNS